MFRLGRDSWNIRLECAPGFREHICWQRVVLDTSVSFLDVHGCGHTVVHQPSVNIDLSLIWLVPAFAICRDRHSYRQAALASTRERHTDRTTLLRLSFC